jgi:tetratricopeptide (TPR) repeat protein
MREWLGKLYMLTLLGRNDEPNRSVDEIVEVNPTSEGWFIRGEMLVEANYLRRALESFNKSLELNPNSPDAWWYKGFILCSEEMGECNENTINRGIHYFDEALKIDPDYAAAWCYKGMLLNYSGRDYEANIALNKALDLYNKEIDKHPGNSRAWE